MIESTVSKTIDYVVIGAVGGYVLALMTLHFVFGAF